ncbi:hypothetical protein N7481_005978 [Penicillium waksmanii]|uniref:uncharacterized protein n=1 Tax=Penicillium waksmanii TaxID=69791 RepID=UPI002549C0A9|nr:uncharacterized protein N7481_005978 [Penicillium waksmanii]KAJ5983879.1 hypothetical protein N7481_005978 [Penicillium waksmanii]
MWKSLISTSQQATRATPRNCFAALCTTPSTASVPFLDSQKTTPPEDIDREELRPERSEVTKSGTDNEIAHHDAAFDPTNTAPESELAATENESKSTNVKGSLNMSPANKDVSAWRRPTEGGPDRNVDRGVSSKKGSPNKRRTVHVKEDGTHVSYR